MRMTQHEPARLAVESKYRGVDAGKITISYYQNSISNSKSCCGYVLVCLVRCFQLKQY